MSNAIYNERIVQMARDSAGAIPLARVDATATLDNPLCGDRVKIDVSMDGERVAAVSRHVKGCILCEAAAVAIARHFPGRTRNEVTEGIDAISRLMNQGELPPERWSALGAFLPVHSVRSRRNCVLLPFRALQKALSQQ